MAEVIVNFYVPIQVLPITVNRYLDSLLDHIQQGNAQGIADILLKLSLSPEQKAKLFKIHFGALQKYTIIDYAVTKDYEDVCKLFSSCGFHTLDEKVKATAVKKGGAFLLAVDSRLDGELLHMGYCSICEETAPLYQLDCNHAFCYSCSTEWARASLYSVPIPCPHKDCPIPIALHRLSKLLSRQDLDLHLSHLTRHTLSSLMSIKWCSHCFGGSCYDQEDDPNCVRECPYCRMSLCMQCDGSSHFGRSCEEALKAKSQEEQDNFTWKAQNTKQCPECKVSIEKNEGCRHMTCKRCSYQFCWMCSGKWIPNNNNCQCK